MCHSPRLHKLSTVGAKTGAGGCLDSSVYAFDNILLYTWHLAQKFRNQGVPACLESDDRVELSISISIMLCKEVAELCTTCLRG